MFNCIAIQNKISVSFDYPFKLKKIFLSSQHRDLRPADHIRLRGTVLHPPAVPLLHTRHVQAGPRLKGTVSRNFQPTVRLIADD